MCIYMYIYTCICINFTLSYVWKCVVHCMVISLCAWILSTQVIMVGRSCVASGLRRLRVNWVEWAVFKALVG